MDKFVKRLAKSIENPENALVIGQGFFPLESLCQVFKSVFIISEITPQTKFRNLIYRENFNDMSQLSNISIVFFGLKDIKKLENVSSVLNRWRPDVYIEGEVFITRDLSKPLYDNRYIAVSHNKTFHIWKSKT